MNSETHTTLAVVVDYSLSLTKMVADGRYDEVHRDITPRNFRLQATGFRQIELNLVQFKRPVAPLEAVVLMKAEGFRPATIEELLALGSQYPEMQKSVPIGALGSAHVVKNRRFVPCLSGSLSHRALTLAIIHRRWSTCYQFAFVKN